jgi:hypothetical protein
MVICEWSDNIGGYGAMATGAAEKVLVPIGSMKSIGEFGPVYEVVNAVPNNPQSIRIRLIETGEELDYPYADMVNDPDAA